MTDEHISDEAISESAYIKVVADKLKTYNYIHQEGVAIYVGFSWDDQEDRIYVSGKEALAAQRKLDARYAVTDEMLLKYMLVRYPNLNCSATSLQQLKDTYGLDDTIMERRRSGLAAVMQHLKERDAN